jgi:hypothetical protein|tara:strand:+ start:863 stop:1411 length:549 start_codon:yes stop_codon:yes gene_type:complete
MGKIFVSTLPDGRLAITQIAGDDPDGLKLAKTMFELSRDGSDLETHFNPKTHTLAKIALGIPKHFPPTCRECDETDLPSDRIDRELGKPNFRDAWEDNGTTIQVNMPKARDIHLGRIRRQRDDELAKLDVPYLKALESGDTAEQAHIAAQKQALRDIPQTFDLYSAKTPESLKSRWPETIPR